MNKKGQSAMEYLMTYGWAILVIIIVIAVLFYIGVLNPRNVTPTTCTFPPGVSCSSFKLTENGVLALTIGQATGHRINVTGIACTQEQAPTSAVWTAQSKIITNGESAALTAFQCWTNAPAAASGTAGETAKFKMWMNYTEMDSPVLTTRQVMGDVTARYEP